MSESARERGAGLWLKGLLPLLLLGGLLAVFLEVGPVGVFRAAFPPVEELTIDRIVFPSEGRVRVHVANGGPEPVTVRQVMVDDAFWSFEIAGGPEIARLERTTIAIPYPWVHGEPVDVTLLTETGVTFHAEVPVATRSPAPDVRYLTTFALIGIYVGVIPVFLGLLWLPFLRGIPRKWLDSILAFTLGLLVFLGVDALAEAIELAEGVSSAFQGIGLITVGLVGTPLVIEVLGTWIGAFSHAPELTVLFLAIGAGAIIQVVWTLGKLVGTGGARDGATSGLAAPLNAFGLVAGRCVMYLTGLLVPA